MHTVLHDKSYIQILYSVTLLCATNVINLAYKGTELIEDMMERQSLQRTQCILMKNTHTHSL